MAKVVVTYEVTAEPVVDDGAWSVYLSMITHLPGGGEVRHDRVEIFHDPIDKGHLESWISDSIAEMAGEDENEMIAGNLTSRFGRELARRKTAAEVSHSN